MIAEHHWQKLRYFIASMKRKFPDLDPDSVEVVIGQVIRKMAPSRNRATMTRECMDALRKAMEKRMGAKIP